MLPWFDANCMIGRRGIPVPEAAVTATDLLREMDRLGIGEALVCHALVSPELKEQVEKICKKGKVPAHDLTGGLATFLHESTGLEPRRDSGRCP